MKKYLIGALVALSLVGLVGVRGFSSLVQMNPADAAALGLLGSKIDTINKYGSNDGLSTSEESISDADDLPTAGDGPARCFDNIGTTPIAISVSSDDAADAGLGIEIEVLDSTWAMSMVRMNLGVAAATTGTVYTQIGSATLLRVNRAFPTGDAFTGNIYIHTDTVDTGTDGVPDLPATQTIAVITAGENQTLQSCYTVPLGFNATLKTFLVSNIANANVRTVTFRLRQSIAGGAERTTNKFSLANGTSLPDPHDPPMAFVEKTDIELTAIASGAGAAVTGTFDVTIFPNTMR